MSVKAVTAMLATSFRAQGAWVEGSLVVDLHSEHVVVKLPAGLTEVKLTWEDLEALSAECRR